MKELSKILPGWRQRVLSWEKAGFLPNRSSPVFSHATRCRQPGKIFDNSSSHGAVDWYFAWGGFVAMNPIRNLLGQ